MDDHSARLARAFRYPSIRTLFPCTLWLHAGAVGLLAAVGGVVVLAHSASSADSALAWLASGVALAAYSWRRLSVAVATFDRSIGNDATTQAHDASATSVRVAAPHHA